MGTLVDLINSSTSLIRMAKYLELSGSRLENMLLNLKWPPPGHLSSKLLDTISLSYEKGKLSDSDVDDIFVHFYDQEKLEPILDDWLNNTFLQKRINILNEIIYAHIHGKYELSIPAILPQIEGIIAEFNSHIGRMKNADIEKYVDSLFADGSHFEKVSNTFFTSTLLENFEWQDPIPKLSRHAILHGADTNYANAANSLRLILLFDYLQHVMCIQSSETLNPMGL